MRFWRKKKTSLTFSVIPLAILVRQVIYDSMLTPTEEIAKAMGLPPISEEVAEMEEKASQARLRDIGPLLPFIDSHADIAGRIAASAYMVGNGDDYVGKDLEQVYSLFRLVSLASSLSCISTLFSLNILQSRMVDNEQ